VGPVVAGHRANLDALLGDGVALPDGDDLALNLALKLRGNYTPSPELIKPQVGADDRLIPV
jgi:hypothetical protein